MTNRRICQFVNQRNGEIDWLEPDTVNKLNPWLRRHNGFCFELINNSDTKKILLIAIKNWRRCAVAMDEVIFATILADVVYSNRELESHILFKEWRQRVIDRYNGLDVFDGFYEAEWTGDNLVRRHV